METVENEHQPETSDKKEAPGNVLKDSSGRCFISSDLGFSFLAGSALSEEVELT